MTTLFCFGLGYSALVLARRLQVDGWAIRGTTRNQQKAGLLAQEGILALPFERDRPVADAAHHLEGVTHVLVSIAPDERGDPVLDAHLEDLRRAQSLLWVGYLSTTAVYGDRGGAWVDETSEIRASQPRALRRIAAEQAWLASGLPAHVFRLAGIYGPGRNALLNLQTGTAHRIVKPGQVFSRIHVGDIANVVEASMARPDPGAIYNVCDDEPAPPQDVVAYAAKLMSIAPPPEILFEEAELSPMARSFYADNRRVKNERIKSELGVRLDYPTYREGLSALLPIDGS